MYKNILIAICCLFSFFESAAQMIDSEKKLFAEEPFFNVEFINKHKIKSISCEYHIKPDKEKMSPKGLNLIYEFSENGQMTKLISRMRMPGGDFDTTYIYYEYDKSGRWITKRTTDNFGFYSINFAYDDKGNIVEEVFNRELNATSAKGNFVLSKQYAMGVEKYEINYFNANFYKKRYLNNNGAPFKEVAFILNNHGKVVEETGTYLNTGMLDRKTYKYDALNRLAEKTEFSGIETNDELVFDYKYDDKNNLLEIKKTKNSEQLLLTEFMVDTRGFITAKITRENALKTIEVVKFQYDFY